MDRGVFVDKKKCNDSEMLGGSERWTSVPSAWFQKKGQSNLITSGKGFRAWALPLAVASPSSAPAIASMREVARIQIKPCRVDQTRRGHRREDWVSGQRVVGAPGAMAPQARRAGTALETEETLAAIVLADSFTQVTIGAW